MISVWLLAFGPVKGEVALHTYSEWRDRPSRRLSPNDRCWWALVIPAKAGIQLSQFLM